MNADKGSSFFYNKTKGEMEESVSVIGFDACFIFRPSLLLGKRNEFRLAESIGKFIMTVFSFLIPHKYKGIRDTQVAAAMIDFMSSGKNGNHVIENEVMLSGEWHSEQAIR